jgi:spore coat polysaccharide biosynthesis predicted glycosyltransferase SpsG
MIYLESDIAISAGGTTCYELAYFGIPNIIITIADNQLKNAKDLDKQKVSIYLGKKDDVTTDKITEKAKELIDNSNLRKSISLNGKKLIDGKGKKRIVEALECYN